MLFAHHVNPRLVKWRQKRAPKRAPSWLWGLDMAPTVSACLSRPCSGILALVGACTRHSYSELYYLCLLSFLFKLLPPPTPPSRPSCPPPNIHWPNINEFHEKNRKNLVKISHYLLVRLVVQKLIDNEVLLCSVNDSTTKARLVFFKMVFLEILASAN